MLFTYIQIGWFYCIWFNRIKSNKYHIYSYVFAWIPYYINITTIQFNKIYIYNTKILSFIYSWYNIGFGVFLYIWMNTFKNYINNNVINI